MANAKNPEIGANATHTESKAMEKATARRPPSAAITCGAYKALTNAPVPHPALSRRCYPWRPGERAGAERRRNTAPVIIGPETKPN